MLKTDAQVTTRNEECFLESQDENFGSIKNQNVRDEANETIDKTTKNTLPLPILDLGTLDYDSNT